MNSLYKLLRVALSCLLCLAMSPTFAEETSSLLIVLSSESNYYREAAREFSTTLASQKSSLKITRALVRDTENSLADKPDIILAVGSKAANHVAELSPEAEVINILLPRVTHQKIVHRGSGKVITSGIYLDQPERRLVNLTLLLPLEIKRVGSVVNSEDMASSTATLKQQFDSRQVEFIFRQMGEREKPIQVLRPLFREIDVFIALPENSVFARAIARWILNFSLQQDIPVIGFSAAYAEAGALLSIYSTPQQIGRQAAELVIDRLENGVLPIATGVAPRYFKIRVNQAVARNMQLNAELMNSSVLQSRLEALETPND